MKTKATVLFVTSAFPLVLLFYVEPPLKWVHDHDILFCELWGTGWCFLAAYIYLKSGAADRRKLLWFSPLVLLAFGIPAFYIFLWIGLTWAAKSGIALP